jgi:hypothetical protein
MTISQSGTWNTVVLHSIQNARRLSSLTRAYCNRLLAVIDIVVNEVKLAGVAA